MRKDGHRNLSRRERQIMDVLYQKGRATAAEIHAGLPDAPSYSAVRAKPRVLEEKRHIRHEAEALRYVYLPVVGRDSISPGRTWTVFRPPGRRQRGIDPKDGSLLHPKVLNTEVNPALAQLALDAVKQWVYSPSLLNGQPWRPSPP